MLLLALWMPSGVLGHAMSFVMTIPNPMLVEQDRLRSHCARL